MASPDSPTNDFSNELSLLAEEYLQKVRSGSHPSVDEFAQRCPQRANEIRSLFPMLGLMEHVGEEVNDASSDIADEASMQQIGDCRIVRQIGCGGMGIVYEAIQEPLGRRVALKVLSRQLASSPTYLERFQREARAAAGLQHTNIVPVFGVGEENGVHYYAMQFIHGRGIDQLMSVLRHEAESRKRQRVSNTPVGQLASVLESGQMFDSDQKPSALPGDELRSGSSTTKPSSSFHPTYFERIAKLGVQAADALAYAHGQGIFHRDIKPSNLLYDFSGNVWITDFGLAKVEGEKDLTATGDVIGTLRYLAPEAFRGKFDARSDIYGLGLTLYELASRRQAFDSGGDLVRKISEEGPSPLSRDSGVPRDLETVIYKAIEREPQDRYNSAESLAEDLRRFLRYEPVSARRLSAPVKLMRWARRHRGLATLSALLLMTLVVGLIASLLVSSRLMRLTNEMQDTLDVSRQNEYAADISVANYTISRTGELTVGKQLLSQLEPRQDGRDYRGWEWDYLSGVCCSDAAQEICNVGEAVYGMDVSDDNRFLVVCAKRRIQLWDLEYHRELATLPYHQPGLAIAAVFTSGGTEVITSMSRGSVSIHSVPTLEELAEVSLGEEFIADIKCSPNGKLVCVLGARSAFLMSYPKLKTICKWPCRCYSAWAGNVCFSQDSAVLITLDNNDLVAYDVAGAPAYPDDSWRPSERFRVKSKIPWARLAISENEDEIWATSRDGIEIYDSKTGERIGLRNEHQGDVRGILQAANGAMCSVATDNSLRLWRRSDDPSPLVLRDLEETLSMTSLHEKSLILTGGKEGSVLLWNLDKDYLATRRSPYRTFSGSLEVEPMSRPIVLPDEQSIVHVTYTPPSAPDGDWTKQTNHVERIDLRSNQKEKLTIEDQANLYTSVLALPDGDSIAIGTGSGEIIIWSLEEKQIRHRFQAFEPFPRDEQLETAIHCGAMVRTVLPDQRALVTYQNTHFVHQQPTKGHIKVLSIDSWEDHDVLVPPKSEHPIQDLWVSVDGVFCAYKPIEGNEVVLWSLADGSRIRTLVGPAGVTFSPVTPSQLIAFEFGGELELYDLATEQKEPIWSLRAQGDGLLSAMFFPDGQRLATASTEKGDMFRVWDVGTRRLMLSLPGSGERPTLNISPRGNVVLARTLEDNDGLINVWQAIETKTDREQSD